jgi:hypothetical protein
MKMDFELLEQKRQWKNKENKDQKAKKAIKR